MDDNHHNQPEQITLNDERERSTKLISKSQVLEIIKNSFDFAHQQLKGRTQEEQLIIGNMVTTLELELKKDIKEL